jgi:hypothetical protein
MLIAQQYVYLMDLGHDVVDLQKKVHLSDEESYIVEAMSRLRQLAVKTLEDTLYEKTEFDDEVLNTAFSEMETVYEDFKLVVFKTGSKGRLGIVTIDAMVHQASLIKRMAKLGIKATRQMHKIAEGLNITDQQKEEEIKQEIIAE